MEKLVVGSGTATDTSSNRIVWGVVEITIPVASMLNEESVTAVIEAEPRTGTTLPSFKPGPKFKLPILKVAPMLGGEEGEVENAATISRKARPLESLKKSKV